MWKTLLPGDIVAVGDTVRYQPNENGRISHEEVYQVVKGEQHYFEIRQEPAVEDTRRKAIRYLDVGYNIRIEKWFDNS